MSEQPPSSSRGAYGVPRCRCGWDSVDRVLDGWSRERPDLDFTPVGVVTRLAKVQHHVDASVAAVLAGYGLSPADFQVIVALRRSGDPYVMAQARLMEALELTSGTVSVRLDRLERNGIVGREPDPGNGRSTLVRLTVRGVELFDAAAPVHLHNEDQLLSALSPQERQTLADLLRKLLSSHESREVLVARHLGLELEPAPAARRRRAAVGLSDTPGLLVSSVGDRTAAAAAGFLRGDLIIEIDGRRILDTLTLAELLDRTTTGQVLGVTVLRGDEPRRLTVAAGAPPSESAT